MEFIFFFMQLHSEKYAVCWTFHFKEESTMLVDLKILKILHSQESFLMELRNRFYAPANNQSFQPKLPSNLDAVV